MRTVIFDLDGTLADTSGDLIAAANVCFRAMGEGDILDPARDGGIAVRGARMMLRTGLGRLGRFEPSEIEPLVEAHFQPLIEAYGAALSVHTTLYEGAMAAVDEIRRRGLGVGICTNKPEGLADQLLQDLGVRDTFGALVGADTLPVRKPDPAPLIETVRRLGGDPARTVLIGDTDTDRNTARAAGVPSVLVTFGPGGGDMAALAPEALLHAYHDLPDLVDQLTG